MSRIVYLEKNEIHNEFINNNVFAAWEGFWLLGCECIPFTWKQFDNLPITKESIVVGWIRTVRKAFSVLEVCDPPEVSIPPSLAEYAGRRTWESTLGEIRKMDEGEARFFIKPLEGHKLFTGHIRTGAMADLIATAMCSDETKILCSEVVNFVSEYRGFVLDKKLIGLKHYSGDFRKMIDTSVVEEAITKYKDAPRAHSIDFGLTDDGRTLLVEVNDAFSLGCYGLDRVWYARMIEARWDEIVGYDSNNST
jgi:ATP-grasp domain, R2K clade family 2